MLIQRCDVRRDAGTRPPLRAFQIIKHWTSQLRYHKTDYSARMLAIRRTALQRRTIAALVLRSIPSSHFHNAPRWREKTQDSRLGEVNGKADDIIHDQFAVLRPDYEVPKNPIILAHGLLGFEELHLAGQFLPGIQYWYGITDALAAKGVEVITAVVPPSGSIEQRAARLAECIERKAKGKAVNIIAYVFLARMLMRVRLTFSQT